MDIVWDAAVYKELNVGDGLFFPIKSNPNKAGGSFFSEPGSGKKVSTDYVSYSMAYKEENGEVVLEYIIPVATAETEKFTGFLLVSDWAGDAKRKVYYQNGEKVNVIALSKQVIRNDELDNKRTKSNCYIIDHYWCTTVTTQEGSHTTCTYEYSSIYCDEPKYIAPPSPDTSSGGSEDNQEAHCEHPFVQGMYVDCNEDFCDEGYQLDQNGNCIQDPCENGYLRDLNGNCHCPSYMEVIDGNCVIRCPDGYSRTELGKCKKIEPCVTDDEVLNAIQEDLEALWKSSNGTHTSIPMQDRMEQGGWIVKSGSDYSFVAFPSDWVTSPCGIDPPADWRDDIPEGLAGWIHTHPFFVGEDISTICEYSEDDGDLAYQGMPSIADGDLLFELCRLTQKFDLKGYAIDGNSIRSYDINISLNGSFESIDKCGY